MKYVIDIDGTLINSNNALEGAAALIQKLNDKNENYVLMTNSIKDPILQYNRLRGAGLPIKENCIINPIVAINEYLKMQSVKKVKVIGTIDEISQVKVDNTEINPELIILLDFEKSNFGYDGLQSIIVDMERGIEVITASISPYYLKSGKKTIDTGAFVRLLESVSGKCIMNFGKPSINYFTIAGSLLQEVAENISIIGDDWSTDIKGANEWGASSILVKTGKYVPGDEYKETPTMLIDSLLDLL